MKLELDNADVVRVLTALTAVMPSGGGSPTFSLINKIKSQTYCDIDETLLFQMCEVVLDDAAECGVIERLPITGF